MNELVARRSQEIDTAMARAAQLAQALVEATTAAEVVNIEKQADAIEGLMKRTGLYSTAEIRPVNETRMRARWKLGQLLAKEPRAKAPGKGKMALTSLTSFLAKLGVTKPTALEAQRIGTLPEADLQKQLDQARRFDNLVTFDALVKVARPYWYKEARKQKHRNIAAKATATIVQPDGKAGPTMGPFALIYADPPWQFEVYSEKGLERTPDQHYPTLTDDKIIDFEVDGWSLRDHMIFDDAALLLWCTSSNMHRALKVMAGWGFEFKTSAVWDKMQTGMGLVFRNQHEVLLYGTRGEMPGPQYQPPSVFRYPRGQHSAKPPEIRTEIEKMYPDFDERTRLELFSRDECREGWTLYGFEANSAAAA